MCFFTSFEIKPLHLYALKQSLILILKTTILCFLTKI